MPKTLQNILILSLLLCSALLFAQPQVLPSVEIRSESSVKAPLLKKPVAFPVEVPTDTIPPQIPRVFTLRYKLPEPSAGTIRPLYLDLSADTSFETSLTASWYPAWQKISLLKLKADFAVPATDFSRSSLSANVQSNFGGFMRFNHLLSWQQSQAPGFGAGSVSYAIENHYPELDVKELRFEALRTQLTLEGIEQELAAKSSDFAFGLTHSHVLQVDGHKFSNRLVLQDTAFGISAQYRAPWLANHLPELDLGLMTDFRHILPALDFHKRLILSRGKYLEIGNHTELQNMSFQDLRESYHWSFLPPGERLVMIPLNLYLQGWQDFNNEDALITRVGVHQTIRFSYNQPELTIRDFSGQTHLRQTDIFTYRLGADLGLHYWGWDIKQDLNLNLEYLQDENWRSRPYSPLLKASTEAKYKLGELDLLATLNQEYFSRNEYGQKLPGIFDLSLGLQYPLRPGLRLTATLDNIFHTPYQRYGNLPESGRTFRIAFRYLPLS